MHIRTHQSILLEAPIGNKAWKTYKNICIPESFNTNILHQLFDYTITFVNSQH